MIHIKKGNTELTVSRGAYRSFYEKCGFTILGTPDVPETNEPTVTHETVHPEKSTVLAHSRVREEVHEDPAEPSVDYAEIPLSELTYDQLCEYADQLGLDRTGIKSAKGLRALIKANR